MLNYYRVTMKNTRLSTQTINELALTFGLEGLRINNNRFHKYFLVSVEFLLF